MDITQICFLLLACLVHASSCARVKIALPRESLYSLQSPQNDACSDYSQVNKSTLSFPEGFQDLPKPWDPDCVTVVRSATVTRGIDRLLGLQVPGLNGVTIRGVWIPFVPLDTAFPSLLVALSETSSRGDLPRTLMWNSPVARMWPGQYASNTRVLGIAAAVAPALWSTSGTQISQGRQRTFTWLHGTTLFCPCYRSGVYSQFSGL